MKEYSDKYMFIYEFVMTKLRGMPDSFGPELVEEALAAWQKIEDNLNDFKGDKPLIKANIKY